MTKSLSSNCWFREEIVIPVVHMTVFSVSLEEEVWTNKTL